MLCVFFLYFNGGIKRILFEKDRNVISKIVALVHILSADVGRVCNILDYLCESWVARSGFLAKSMVLGLFKKFQIHNREVGFITHHLAQKSRTPIEFKKMSGRSCKWRPRTSNDDVVLNFLTVQCCQTRFVILEEIQRNMLKADHRYSTRHCLVMSSWPHGTPTQLANTGNPLN